jgi:DNA-binding NtrC family response regulator/predicted HTH transcriptional regulator
LPDSTSVSAISEILVSFANSNDGKLIFGVSSGIVKGVKHPNKTKQRVSTAASFPHCRPDLHVGEPTVIELDGAPLVVFNVQKQNLMRCTGDGRCLLRQNGTVTPNFALFEESSFESQPLQVRFGPVPSYRELFDEKRIAGFRENLSQHKPGLADLNESDLLARFGCIVETDGNFVPSIAGLLIFGKDPGKYLPSYGIRAVRFKGTDIAENDELYIDRLEIDEPIPVAIDRLMAFIRRNIRAGAELKDVDRADVFEYPSVALREAVVNCLVYLDYSLRQKASVYIYDDRIEFTTPGGLPRGASIEKMRSKLPQHWPRNLRVCEVMQYVEKSFENLGSGIRRMAKAMADAGLPEPKFADDGIQFKVTLMGQGTGSSELLETALQHVEPPQIEIVGSSPALQRVLAHVGVVAPIDATVLICGETGTGKELIARAIHNRSRRKERSFVKLNCAAIPAGLVESELFGHEKGAFTGAISQKIGRLELANQGTLFLDEVGDIPLEIQPKLLRALQDRQFERLGATKTVNIDVRVVAATNRNLAEMVEDGHFRSDLYYRLNVFPISVPPLRERKDDIPVLVRYFVQKFAQQMQKQLDPPPAAAIDALMNWSWPGNVRELQNLIERAVILTQGTVLNVPLEELREPSNHVSTVDSKRHDVERNRIIEALRATSGKIEGDGGAAERLGLKRTTLQDKIRQLKISLADYSH